MSVESEFTRRGREKSGQIVLRGTEGGPRVGYRGAVAGGQERPKQGPVESVVPQMLVRLVAS